MRPSPIPPEAIHLAKTMVDLCIALEAILAIDSPYCENCGSDDICKAYAIARDALAKAKAA